MSETRIKELFNCRFFEIPKYQRGYAWEKKNIRELFEDIEEANEVKATGHYIGTVVLTNSIDEDTFYVVDGQQRITTITLIINCLIGFMDEADKAFYGRVYIQYKNKYRLIPLGRENTFFRELISSGSSKLEPKNRSQRLLIEAYEEIHEILKSKLKNIDSSSLLAQIENLRIMEFIEKSEADAIRIFQTVNDRGKPLTNVEKAKSLLVYFSNRYLNAKLDNKINDVFGEIFEIYDEIKHLGTENNIDLISGRYGDFNEDNIMRYHFVTFSDEDYDPSAAYVLEYLKRELKLSRNVSGRDQKIEEFITNYIGSLLSFFKSLNEIINKVPNEIKYFKLFSVLGLSATLYPLITILNEQNILEENLSSEGNEKLKLIDLVEIIDVRVYKIRGTDPKADIVRFSYYIKQNNTEYDFIENWLYDFNYNWMTGDQFKNNLYSEIYQRSRAVLPHILLDYSENLENKKADLKTLKKYVSEKAFSIEHVLSQKPKFGLKTHGFKSNEEYLEYEHTLGNLTLLEKSLNSSVNNKNVYDKVNTYDKSDFKVTKKLASEISLKDQFKKDNIKERTEEIVSYLVKRWWC